MATKKAAKAAPPPAEKWWGGFTVHVECPVCRSHNVLARLKDGSYSMRPHTDYKSGRYDACKNNAPQSAYAALYRAAWAARVYAEIEKRTRGWGSYEPPTIAPEVLASQYNGTPGFDDLRVLFMLFRDVLKFLTSDALWRAVAVQSAAEAAYVVTSPERLAWALDQLTGGTAESPELAAAVTDVRVRVGAADVRALDGATSRDYRKRAMTDYGCAPGFVDTVHAEVNGLARSERPSVLTQLTVHTHRFVQAALAADMLHSEEAVTAHEDLRAKAVHLAALYTRAAVHFGARATISREFASRHQQVRARSAATKVVDASGEVVDDDAAQGGDDE